MTTKKSLKDKVQKGVKSIVPAVLIGFASLGNIDSAQAQSSGDDPGFRFNLNAGGKYSGNFSTELSASPQFNLNKKGDNAVWLGPYFNYNFGNDNSDTETKGPYSESQLVSRSSGIQRDVDSLKKITNSFEKPYGFGVSLTHELGEDNLSELELRAGLTKKNTSTNKYAEKSIVYSRDNETLSQETISDTDKSSDSKYIPNVRLGYNRELFDAVNAGAFIGYSDNFYGGVSVGIPIGDK